MGKRYISDSREGEQNEAFTREDTEVIARCSRNLHHEDDGEDQIDSQQRQQQPWALLGQRKGNNNKEKDKKENSNSTKRKMQEKTKILLSRLGKFDNQLDGTKNKAASITTLQSTAPFPYNGIDFGGSPPCNPCLLRPSIPLPSSPKHKINPAAAKTPSPANTAKPKLSSHYVFVKSLIEMNDFYSHVCNAHYDISNGQAK